MDIEREQKEQLREAARAERKDYFAREDDAIARQAVEDYYNKPQSEIQFDYLYVTPGAPDAGFDEWTRDSILSNYDKKVQKKISLCVDQLRILEMMKADATIKKDSKLVEQFITPLFRFIHSEKTALENTSRNIDGFNAQTSRSQFNTIQQFRYNEERERQEQGRSFLEGLKLPRPSVPRGANRWSL